MADHPLPQPLGRPQVEAILYLAERMAFVDLRISTLEQSAILRLAACATNHRKARRTPGASRSL